MEYGFLICFTGFFFGLIAGLFGAFILMRGKEGNRQDYIIKIGVLKREKANLVAEKKKLVERTQQLERYLEMSNEEAKDNRDNMLVYSRDLELERDKNRQLMKEISVIRSGLKLMRKAN